MYFTWEPVYKALSNIYGLTLVKYVDTTFSIYKALSNICVYSWEAIINLSKEEEEGLATLLAGRLYKQTSAGGKERCKFFF